MRVGSFLLLSVEKSFYMYNVGRAPETNVFLFHLEVYLSMNLSWKKCLSHTRVELEIVKPFLLLALLIKLHHTFLSAGSIGKVKKLAPDKTYFPFGKNSYE